MSLPCNSCGVREAVSGDLCGSCESEQQRLGADRYPVWSEDSGNPRPGSGKRHERRVEETRQHLGDLPDLYVQLWLFREPGSAPKDPDQRSGKSNPAHQSVINLDVLDLTDVRLKDDADDTRTDYELDRRAGARRQGVINTLAAWVRLVHSERREQSLPSEPADEPTISTECGYLLAHLDWFAAESSGFDEMHDDVAKMWADVRRAIGEREEREMRCRYCQNIVRPVDSMYEPTSWETCAFGLCEGCKHPYAIGPELAALGRVQDSVPLETVGKVLGIPLPTLYRWLKAGVFNPAPDSPKRPTNRRPALFDVATVREQTTLLRTA